jgi:1-acyl-sn-glycerol-3-phosphate acyltransferase
MMGRDMMTPNLRFLWEFTRVIPVDRDGSDSTSAREALRELRRSGVLGIFPEGGIERPPRMLRPFLPGIGTIIVRSGAAVLPVFIQGTPDAPTAMGSITRRGYVRIQFGPVMAFAGFTPQECVLRLQSWFESVSGWPTARLNLWEDPTAPRE